MVNKNNKSITGVKMLHLPDRPERKDTELKTKTPEKNAFRSCIKSE